MADKQISELTSATTIGNSDLFVLQQGGTAKKLTGEKLTDFVYAAAAEKVEEVEQIVAEAQTAIDSLEEQKNEIAQTIASMAELGTDTTLTTPGMAADAAATGVVKDTALARFEQAEITGVPIATFDDGAENVPVKALKIAIEPQQDLHGYDNPWPAGGGKNLLPDTMTSPTTINEVTFTRNSKGEITYSGAPSSADFSVPVGEVTLAAGTYFLNGAVSESARLRVGYASGGTLIGHDTGGGYSFTLSESSAINVNMRISSTIGSSISGTFKPMIVSSSVTDRTFAPYFNICPITGWTGANVTRTGKNLYDYTKTEQNKWVGENGIASASGYWLSDYIFLKANQTYYRPQTGSVRNAYFDLEKNFKSYVAANDVAITPTEDCYVRFVGVQSSYPSDGNIQLELGSTATAYEPYNGTTYSITFPTEAGTVYGGTLDVTNGVLTVNWAKITIGAGTNVSNNGKTLNSTHAFITPSPDKKPGNFNFISNIFTTNGNAYDFYGKMAGRQSTGGVEVYLPVSVEDDTSSVKAWLIEHGTELCYELATPITYTLTPSVVRTLLALNNILADTGNINDLIYRKMPIPVKELENTLESMIAGVEETMEATQNYAVDKLVIAVHKLYHIDSNIASGETLVPGVNCSVTTIEAELSSLKTSVNDLNLALGSLGSLATLNYQVVT